MDVGHGLNPFLLSAAERLNAWRRFRDTLPNLELQEKLAAVAVFWGRAPLSVVPDPTNWPSIWQMMQTNVWSANSVAIGMEATLRLAGLTADRMTLQLIRVAQDELLVLLVDDKWLLNYDWGSLRLYSTIGHDIIRQWQFVGKDYLTL